MNLLITGGSGTLGREISRIAIENNHVVNILTRNKNLKSDNSSLNYFYWNPSKNEIDRNCFIGVDSVINLSGFSVFSYWNKRNKSKILNSRVISTQFILSEIFKNKIQIKSFVSASAISAYQDSYNKESYENDKINNESSFINQVVTNWESVVNNYIKRNKNISFSILRVGLVLSKEGGLYKMCRFLSKFYILSPLGSGKQWQSWIHVYDAARIFLEAATNSWNGEINVVSPNPVKQKELIHKIVAYNKSIILFPNIPSIIVKLIFGEMSEIVLSSQKIKSKKLNVYRFKYPNLDEALGSF